MCDVNFLARITTEDASGRRTVNRVACGISDELVEAVAQLKEALRKLLGQRDEGKLPTLKCTSPSASPRQAMERPLFRPVRSDSLWPVRSFPSFVEACGLRCPEAPLSGR